MNLPLTLHDAIKTAAAANDIEPALVAAFVDVESSGNTLKSRYEPNFSYFVDLNKFASLTGVSLMTERVQQATSWGLMQVMGARARGLGFKDLFPDLCYVDIGLQVGCLALKDLQRRFPGDTQVNSAGQLTWSGGLCCAYNHGHPELNPMTGLWVVEGYVMAIRGAYDQAVAAGL